MSQCKRLLDESGDGGPRASSTAAAVVGAAGGDGQQQQQQNRGGQTSGTSATTTDSGSSSANGSGLTARRQGDGQGSGVSWGGNDEEEDGQGEERPWAPAEELRYWAVTQTLRLALFVAFVGLVRSVLSSQAIFYLVLWVASLTSMASMTYRRVRERGLLTYLPPSTQQLLLQTSLLDWLLDTSMADRLKPYAVIGMGLNEEERSFLISSLSPPEQRALTAPGLLNALPSSVQSMLLPRGGGSDTDGMLMSGGGGCVPATPAAADIATAAAAGGGGGEGGREGWRHRVEEISEMEAAELTRRRLREMGERRRREEGREGEEEGEEVMTASETDEEDEYLDDEEEEDGGEGGRRTSNRIMHQFPRRVGMAMDMYPQRRTSQQGNGLRPAFPFSSTSHLYHQQPDSSSRSSSALTTTTTTQPPPSPPPSSRSASESWPAPGEVDDVAAFVLQRRLRRAWGQAVRGSRDAIVSGVTESLRRQWGDIRQGFMYGGVALAGGAVVAQVWRGRGGGGGGGGEGGGGGVVQRYGRMAVFAGTVGLALYDAYFAVREGGEEEQEEEEEGLWEEEGEEEGLLGADSAAGVSVGQQRRGPRRRRPQQQQQHPRVWVQWGAFFLLLLLIRTGRLAPILRRLRAALPASFSSSSSSSSLLLGASRGK